MKASGPPAPFPLWQVPAVALGGAIGGSGRALLIHSFPVQPASLPWVILAENLTGAFLLGLILTLLLRRPGWPPSLRPLLCTGVLGSFTTFSNLSLDLVALGTAGEFALALFYALGSVILGLAAALLGIRLGRQLSPETGPLPRPPGASR